jgi:hypothetical protein
MCGGDKRLNTAQRSRGRIRQARGGKRTGRNIGRVCGVRRAGRSAVA